MAGVGLTWAHTCSSWSVCLPLPQLPPGSAVPALVKLAEYATEVIHRYYLIMQWHRYVRLRVGVSVQG